MNIAKIKPAGYLALAIGLSVGGGYSWARTVHRPQIVEINSTACGVPTSSARFGVPLQTILQASGGMPFAIGPVDLPGSRPISLRFETSVDGTAGEVRVIDDVLYLPIAFGPDQRPPRQITLHCRDGLIGSVRYHGDGSEGATFSVVRAAAGAPARGRSAPLTECDTTLRSPTVCY